MPTRKTTLFYIVLIAIASAAVGMVIASQWGLSSTSSAQTVSVPAANSAPLGGPIDATTFRNIAKTQAPVVVNIRTQARVRGRELTEFQGGDDLLRRFFGQGDRGKVRARVAAAAGRHRTMRRFSRARAPASSSTRPDSSSRTTTWSRTPTRSRSGSTA